MMLLSSTTTGQFYFVFWSALMQLLTFCCCPECASKNLSIRRTVTGTFLVIRFACRDCHTTFRWQSQPFYGSFAAGNILLSASVLFAGATITKFLRVLNHMGVSAISSRTFFWHQKSILFKALDQLWNDRQTWLLSSLQTSQEIVCVGDGRADSPGHSAKYGCYTLIELKEKAVIDIQIVQVWFTPFYFFFMNAYCFLGMLSFRFSL